MKNYLKVFKFSKISLNYSNYPRYQSRNWFLHKIVNVWYVILITRIFQTCTITHIFHFISLTKIFWIIIFNFRIIRSRPFPAISHPDIWNEHSSSFWQFLQKKGKCFTSFFLQNPKNTGYHKTLFLFKSTTQTQHNSDNGGFFWNLLHHLSLHQNGVVAQRIGSVVSPASLSPG